MRVTQRVEERGEGQRGLRLGERGAACVCRMGGVERADLVAESELEEAAVDPVRREVVE